MRPIKEVREIFTVDENGILYREEFFIHAPDGMEIEFTFRRIRDER